MKAYIKVILICLLTFLTISCSDSSFHDNHVIAHRGAWKDTGLPQNSLASFQAAAIMGCHGSECDVWLSADDSLVICHDATRDGKRIDSMCYEEVTSVLLENGEKIPTLREYITIAKKYPRTKLIIDLKTNKEPDRTLRMLQMIDKLVKDLDCQEQVEYILGYHPLYEAFSKMTTSAIAYLGHYKNGTYYDSTSSETELFTTYTHIAISVYLPSDNDYLQKYKIRYSLNSLNQKIIGIDEKVVGIDEKVVGID
jgi:glycerophosphoryl diester phosphodiesterase